MSKRAAKHFSEELFALVERFRLEYVELTYVEMAGCLECAKYLILAELNEDDEEDEEEDDDISIESIDDSDMEE